MLPRSAQFLLSIVAFCCTSPIELLHADERPNVVLIMTDDQGIGDFGITGNPVIQTPNIDTMARQGATMTTFYVSPVCSPTRACLMTGRYNYRTRCIDTWIGRSMMDPDETTIAEVLSNAGYATGIFGKWHLGDCYPMRSMDQGFEESLVLRGGGLAQPSDPKENGNRYTNPILFHNGHQVETESFCTDVYFTAAIQWIEKSHAENRPFFVYLPTNAPHGPFHDVPEELRAYYMKQTEPLARLIVGHLSDKQRESAINTLARIAAMITNIDENVGRLFEKLDELRITDNTLVIFLVDNGPNTRRYVGRRRGMKSDIHEGGIRSPLWLHWPARFKAGSSCDTLAAHIDIMPTILEACQVDLPADLKLDGRSLLPLLDGRPVAWPDRSIVIQSHRGDRPVRYHHFMIRDARWKLLHASGFGRESFQGEPEFELYDVVSDPQERINLATKETAVLERLKADYNAWFDDVSSTRPDNYAPPRIWIGTPHERKTTLTRQDWRGGTWDPESIGYWELHVAESGHYEVRLEFDPKAIPGIAKVEIGDVHMEAEIPADARTCTFHKIVLPAGATRFRGLLVHDGKDHGVYQAIISKN
ncbi:MAG: arylsulfatase [Pirellulales bacterium]|nr:arylsulfatase [Pirellulales bacterium]